MLQVRLAVAPGYAQMMLPQDARYLQVADRTHIFYNKDYSPIDKLTDPKSEGIIQISH